MTPPLLAALMLVARLHRATRDGRDDPEARKAIHAAARRMGREERECLEAVARGFKKEPGWWLIGEGPA